jgi:energy-converting hydrogenase Eha subunit C
VLNGGDIGALASGMNADLACVPFDDVGMAGALRDPLGPLFFCHVRG